MRIVSGWSPRLAKYSAPSVANDAPDQSISDLLSGKASETSTGLFAVVDASRGEIVLEKLAASRDTYQSLYQGKDAEKHFSVSPILIDCATDSEITRWLTSEAWGQNYAIFLTSAFPLDTLLIHCRRLLTVVTEAGEMLLFRFYDPRVLRVYLPTCNLGELSRIFGPVGSFLVESEEGAILDYDLGQHSTGLVPTTARTTDSLGRLIIRRSQVESLSREPAKRQQLAELQEFHKHGCQSSIDSASGDVRLEDAAGSPMRVSALAGGAMLTTAEGLTWQSNVDARGRPTTLTDPGGNKVQFEHDDRDRLIRTRYGLQPPYEFEYNEDSNLVTLRYPNGATTRFEHQDGRLSRITDRNGANTRLRYDSDNLLAEISDSLNNRTLFEYDRWQTPSRIVLPNGDIWSFEFDDRGHLQKFLVNGEEVGRLEISDDGDTITFENEDGTFTRLVFAGKKLQLASNEWGTVSLQYNQAGHLVREEFAGQVVTYDRNPVGALLALVAPDGSTLNFKRDRDHRVRRIVDWDGDTYEIDYQGNGAPSRIRYPNGTSTELASKRLGLIEAVDVLSADADQAPFVSHIWKYDECDRLTQDSSRDRTLEYFYDREGRLLDVSVSGRRHFEYYQLDPNGNRVMDRDQECDYNGFNQLLRRGREQYRYDNRGNQIEGFCPSGPARFRYNCRNQLIEVVTSKGSVRYAYDALGRRIRKWSGKQTTTYVWAGQQLLNEVTSGVQKLQRRDYLFLPETPVPLAIRVDGHSFALHPGRRFEPLCATDSNGKMVWRAEYDAYGAATITINEVDQPWRLPGQYYDQETGLHYNLARYYNPALGRFLSLDPLLVAGGSLNFYTYCDGDPLNRVDPTGAFAPLLLVGALFLGGAAVAGAVEFYQSRDDIKKGDYDMSRMYKALVIGAGLGVVGGLAAIFTAETLVAVAGVGATLATIAGGGVGAAVAYCTYAGLGGEPFSGQSLLEWTAAGLVFSIGAAAIGRIAGAIKGGSRAAAPKLTKSVAAGAEGAERVSVAELAGRQKARAALSKPYNDAGSVWDLKSAARAGDLKSSLDNFATGTRDRKPYGQKAKTLKLHGKSASEIERELQSEGFREKPPKPNAEYRQDIWVHEDGSVVKIKPEAYPGDRYGRGPIVSKSVQFDQRLPESYHNEAFKVSEEGYPVPKSSKLAHGMKQSPPRDGAAAVTDRADEEVGWIGETQSAGHIALPKE